MARTLRSNGISSEGPGSTGLLLAAHTDVDPRPSLWHEIKDLGKLTVPLFFSRASFIVMKTTDSSLLGHTGTRFLEAVALSDLWTASTGVLIQSRAVSMFCGQAFGAGNKHLVGIWIQVAYAVLFPLCIIVAILWSLTGTFFRAVGKGEMISDDANYFAVVLMLCLPIRIAFSQLNAFFTAMRITRPSVVCSTSGMVLNLIGGLVLVLGIPFPKWHGYGFNACPWVTTVVEYVQFGILWYVYCYKKQLHVDCWPGWSRSHVTRERVNTFLKQFIPQVLSGASDWWRVSAIGAIASSLGDINVAVWNTGYRICWIALAFNGSLNSAVGVKVGIALGQGNGALARRQCIVGISLCVLVTLVLSIVVMFFARQLGLLFSSDEEVLDLFEESRFALAAFVGLMNLSVVLEGIPNKVGRSRITFWYGVVGSWVGQVPGAYLCTKYWRDDLVGLYAGSAVGYGLLCVLLASAFLSFDWDQLAAEAAARSETRAPVAAVSSSLGTSLQQRKEGSDEASETPPVQA